MNREEFAENLKKTMNDAYDDIKIRNHIRRVEKLAIVFKIPNWEKLTLGTLHTEVTNKLAQINKIIQDK